MRRILIIAAATILHSFLHAQDLALKKDASSLYIQGTSTLHDWESVVKKIEASAKMNSDALSEIKFIAEVKSIKSGKSGMDKNTYKAMKAEEFPQVTFESDRLTIDNVSLVGEGLLTIAGTSKTIPVSLKISSGDEISISGEINIKMTDYGITPPVAVFGTIKTGDDIKIKLEFLMTKI